MAKSNRSLGGPARARSDGARQYYAALDLGTNNCRLLIAERLRVGGFRVVDSYSQIVRLGEGLAASGRLSEAAMARAREAVSKCVERVRRYTPIQAKYIATQACRAAANGRQFLNDLQTSYGVRLQTISPKEEAKFALLGTLDLIDPGHDFALVIDIGGGSTELCFVDAKSAAAKGIEGCAIRPPILGWMSAPVGVVTLSETFPGREHGWYARMVEHVKALLSANDAAGRFGPLFRANRGQLIGNSGTVTCLAAVNLGLSRYNRTTIDGVWLNRAAAVETRIKLHNSTAEERAAEPCIGPDRADLILAGCAILEAVWALWPAERMRVGDRGLREGILLSMMHAGTAAPASHARRRRRPQAKAEKGASS